MNAAALKKLKKAIAATVSRVVLESLHEYDAAIKSSVISALNAPGAGAATVTAAKPCKPRKPRKPRAVKHEDCAVSQDD